MYRGDFRTGKTVPFTFTTVNTSGVPTQLAGTPALSVYKNNSTTQSTSGVTLIVDFDAVTGLNHVAVDTSLDGTFYSAGSDFSVVITTGTVGGSSVVGYTVGSFSLENRSALMPTTDGRKLDVSAGGEAGVDWANVGGATTAVALTNTTISTAQTVASVSGAVGSVAGAVGSVTGNVGGTINGFTAGAKAEIEAEAVDAIVLHRLDELLNADSDIDGAAPPAVGSVFHELMSKTAGSFTFDQTTDSNEAIRDRGDAAWITATGFSTLDAAGVRAAVGLAAADLDSKIAGILTTALSEAYRATGATGSAAQLLYEIIAHMGESAISGTTKTLKKLDGATTAKTYTLDSATTPTSITETT